MVDDTAPENNAASNKRKLEEHLARMREGNVDFKKSSQDSTGPGDGDADPSGKSPKPPPKPPPQPSGWEAWKSAHKGRFHNISMVDRQEVARQADYGLLDLKPGASKEEVRKGFNELAKKHHPDLGGDKEIFQAMRAAHDRIMKE